MQLIPDTEHAPAAGG